MQLRHSAARRRLFLRDRRKQSSNGGNWAFVLTAAARLHCSGFIWSPTGTTLRRARHLLTRLCAHRKKSAAATAHLKLSRPAEQARPSLWKAAPASRAPAALRAVCELIVARDQALADCRFQSAARLL